MVFLNVTLASDIHVNQYISIYNTFKTYFSLNVLRLRRSKITLNLEIVMPTTVTKFKNHIQKSRVDHRLAILYESITMPLDCVFKVLLSIAKSNEI